MAITYNWVFNQNSFQSAPSEDGLTDVVKIIHWRYRGVDGDYSAEVYSTYACPAPNPDDYTPYDEITEPMAIEWLEAGLDIESLQANISAQIEEQKNPKIVSLPLPWENTQA